MNFKIVADSSSDILHSNAVPYSSVPLKIITDYKEYTDNDGLDTAKMTDELKRYRGTSRSSCPNPEEFKAAYNGYDGIFCVTITSGLSGSYSSASLAMQEYTEENPDCRGTVIDTLSVGPESALIIRRLEELIADGRSFDEICTEIEEYKSKTHLIFCLESLKNLANNGRVSHAVAKIAGLLGIRVVGKASNQGTLELTAKSRGSEKALAAIIENMQAEGYSGGRVRIHHCFNPDAANQLKMLITSFFGTEDIVISPTGGLCSFYAEEGGLLVGFEGKRK